MFSSYNWLKINYLLDSTRYKNCIFYGERNKIIAVGRCSFPFWWKTDLLLAKKSLVCDYCSVCRWLMYLVKTGVCDHISLLLEHVKSKHHAFAVCSVWHSQQHICIRNISYQHNEFNTLCHHKVRNTFTFISIVYVHL